MEVKTKVYLYTRVSTTMQIDGYSLEAQKTKMKAFCDYNEYEIAGEYEDAGKSGKSIEGRIAFNQMMDDIKFGKDEVSYVLVFKLSRFGRNAADVLAVFCKYFLDKVAKYFWTLLHVQIGQSCKAVASRA